MEDPPEEMRKTTQAGAGASWSGSPPPKQYAHRLFDFMRRCDAAGVETIYCQTVEPTGIGAAIMDRLQRAAKGSAGSRPP